MIHLKILKESNIKISKMLKKINSQHTRGPSCNLIKWWCSNTLTLYLVSQVNKLLPQDIFLKNSFNIFKELLSTLFRQIWQNVPMVFFSVWSIYNIPFDVQSFSQCQCFFDMLHVSVQWTRWIWNYVDFWKENGTELTVL